MVDKVAEAKTFYNAEEKVWRGPEKTLKYTSEQSLGNVLVTALLKDPYHKAQVTHPIFFCLRNFYIFTSMY